MYSGKGLALSPVPLRFDTKYGRRDVARRRGEGDFLLQRPKNKKAFAGAQKAQKRLEGLHSIVVEVERTLG
jgi:hypothetical protein